MAKLAHECKCEKTNNFVARKHEQNKLVLDNVEELGYKQKPSIFALDKNNEEQNW